MTDTSHRRSAPTDTRYHDARTAWAGWVVFGVIVAAALGGAIAVWNREYPQMSKKRTFTRDSESKW